MLNNVGRVQELVADESFVVLCEIDGGLIRRGGPEGEIAVECGFVGVLDDGCCLRTKNCFGKRYVAYVMAIGRRAL